MSIWPIPVIGNDAINPNTVLQHCLGLPPILYGPTDPMGQEVTL